jgi:two-component system phosphate regulon sensor histidine kinase PhoR
VLVIASRSFSKFIQNFRFSKIFVKEILSLSILFALLIFILFHISFTKLFSIALIILIFDLIILNSIGYKRRKEIEEIKSVIKSIRKNKISNENEIHLTENLKDLEGNIKAMFLRTQNDLIRMEKLAQARTDFLGYVSHELRTPIFTIQGYLETLLNGAIDDKKVNRTFIQKAIHHSQNLNNLLNDLIDISMIESGLMSLSFRYFNLFNFLTEILNEIKLTKANPNIGLSLSQDDTEVEVFGDKEKLKQVMVNLISNALKYTNQGSVEIIVDQKSKFVTITIKDTGIGISEADQIRIFERFFRTDRERSSSVTGTGLGLAIVKHILEAHNTSIDLKSELGVGSQFTFKLKKG